MKKAPAHKENRARDHIDIDWKKVIFSDEKKFNLDGPDGNKYYWHDLRKDSMLCGPRNFGGGSLMEDGAWKIVLRIEQMNAILKRKKIVESEDCKENGALTSSCRKFLEGPFQLWQEEVSGTLSKAYGLR